MRREKEKKEKGIISPRTLEAYDTKENVANLALMEQRRVDVEGIYSN